MPDGGGNGSNGRARNSTAFDSQVAKGGQTKVESGRVSREIPRLWMPDGGKFRDKGCFVHSVGGGGGICAAVDPPGRGERMLRC